MTLHFPDGLPPVLPITIAQVRRRLPEGSQVVLGPGNRVAPGDVVARPPVAAPVTVDVAAALHLSPASAISKLHIRPGERVVAQQLLARHRGRVCRAPADGTVAAVDSERGSITLIREQQAPSLVAGLRGYIAAVRPGREMLIETGAAVVRCPFGLGGEAYGRLRVVGEREQALSEAAVDARSGGAIVAGGTATAEVLRKARDTGAIGVVLGGIDAGELAAFLDCEPDALLDAVARYAGPPALLLSGGFGVAAMDQASWEVLQAYDRHEALLDAGSTPARLVVPLPRLPGGVAPLPPTAARPGMRVRLVDEPHLGAIGTLVALHGQARFPSGVRCAAATVRLGERDVTVALAAVEALVEAE